MVKRWLEQVLQELHDSEINAGVETFFDAGMRAWIGDARYGIAAERTFNRIGAPPNLEWPDVDAAGRWLHEKAIELHPDSAYARRQLWLSGPTDNGAAKGVDKWRTYWSLT